MTKALTLPQTVLIAVLLAPQLALAVPIGGATPAISVGASPTVNVGDVFTIPILVSGVSDLMAFQLDLEYDSGILTALSFTDVGTDFDTAATSGGGNLTGITGFLLPGLLSGAADSMSGALTGLSGNGSLLFVEFQAIARGGATLTLSRVFLDFSELGADAIGNGSVAVEEPSSFALIAVGFLALYWQRRRTRSSLGPFPDANHSKEN